jgi:hypothetical protein
MSGRKAVFAFRAKIAELKETLERSYKAMEESHRLLGQSEARLNALKLSNLVKILLASLVDSHFLPLIFSFLPR